MEFFVLSSMIIPRPKKKNTPKMKNKTCFVGIDLGTSGCRAIAIDSNARILAEQQKNYHHSAKQTPDLWWKSIRFVLNKLIPALDNPISHIAIDGTSGTLLLTDKKGKPTSPVLFYNDNRAIKEVIHLRRYASAESGAHGIGSSLSKLLYLRKYYPKKSHYYALHQADWAAGQFMQRFGNSDENNCLKLGYDPIKRCWPDWLDALKIPAHYFPQVYSPSRFLGEIDAKIATDLGLPLNVKIIAGTTDSIAAFLATGVQNIGEAVTSLGSTLAIKLISNKAIFAPEYGVYSHRLGHIWLVGGASNTGGAVLKQYFSTKKLITMTKKLPIMEETGFDYYPLTTKGERFPWANPEMLPRLSPRPESDLIFFQAMLEGMAKIEKTAYQRLQALGAPWPSSIRTVGGGSVNQAWKQIRQKRLKIPLFDAQQVEAAYGTALLAMGNYL